MIFFVPLLNLSKTPNPPFDIHHALSNLTFLPRTFPYWPPKQSPPFKPRTIVNMAAPTAPAPVAPPPPAGILTVTGRVVRGNIYYPDTTKYRFTLGEPGDSGLLNFRIALLQPGRPTMRGTTAQRVKKGLEDITEFLNSKTTELLRGHLPEDKIRETAARLSTRGQIAAFALSFRLEGLAGVDVGTCNMPLDAGDIIGLLYTAGLYYHRIQIETGLGLVLGAAVLETVFGIADGPGDVRGPVTVDRTLQDVNPSLQTRHPLLTRLMRHRGLTARWSGAGIWGRRRFVTLSVQSIGLGHRKWMVTKTDRSDKRALRKAVRAVLPVLQAAYSNPAVF
ncbi:hypothetical protein TWF281_004837 [Arthrobotrys megalospora]